MEDAELDPRFGRYVLNHLQLGFRVWTAATEIRNDYFTPPGPSQGGAEGVPQGGASAVYQDADLALAMQLQVGSVKKTVDCRL